MIRSAEEGSTPTRAADSVQGLTLALVRRLEDAVCSVGAFGEVRIIILKGRVRFIEVLRSESVDGRVEAREFLE